ncbi:Aste57867_3561 [Aphanomyces stellatus]|uniref:Aste57867_3561 protein n=1 Tax=Aphanomyces stellatus TaxID=120398 RepID=A0A485KEE1_9STRA|nr:hypothetical protein As57867_003550 [Aphanomyces stellatus]VFT80724.1 Aste57867_3561 [Aphanomyces stellatus]
MISPVPPRLPSELLLKIVLWLPDAASLFSVLEVLGTADQRGPFFESLWQLGSSFVDRDHLWPSLALTEMLSTPGCHTLVESVIDSYAHVQSICPSATIAWRASFPSSPSNALVHSIPIPLNEWFDLWVQLPLTELTITSFYDDTTPALPFIAATFLDSVLPQLRRLVRLQCEGDGVGLLSIFEMAAASTTLEEIDIRLAAAPPLTETQLVHATQWLSSLIVRRFYVPFLALEPTVPPTVRNAWDLSQLKSEMLPTTFAFRELHLSRVLTPSGLVSLAHAIRHSTRMDGLTVNEFAFLFGGAYAPAFGVLFDSVADSNVRELDVSRCRLADSHWPLLGPIFERSKNLRHVTLSNNGISNEGLVWIARAIGTNTSIERLDLDGNTDVTVGGVVHLLSNCDFNRRGSFLLNLGFTSYSVTEKIQLQTLAGELRVDLYL